MGGVFFLVWILAWSSKVMFNDTSWENLAFDVGEWGVEEEGG